jgi:AcrR family transcriptional regulator
MRAVKRPTGLRERKKRERERRILTAAGRLFGRRGGAATAMDDVARSAGLAVGTVYNYFRSKNDLLLAIVRRETERALQGGREIVEDPPSDPAEAVIALARTFLDGFADEDRRLWRELLGAAIAQPRTLGKRLFESDLMLISQMGSLLEVMRTRGLVRADLDVAHAATALYAVCFSVLTAYLMYDDISADAMRGEVSQGIRILTRGLLPSGLPEGTS